mmetsp:Transcript_28844/g.57580  ORF Transcript_28844/g.57580 Transcript_28844/m.57580 type:complete len:393 (+) Transcript_28844:2-1180(+)
MGFLFKKNYIANFRKRHEILMNKKPITDIIIIVVQVMATPTHRVNAITLPFILLALISLSPACARAFNSGIVSPLPKTTSPFQLVTFCAQPPSSNASFGRFHRSQMKSGSLSPSSLLSFHNILFLRGGQQDGETVTSDETTDLYADINMRRNYGTQESSASTDEEASAASVEMADKSSVGMEDDSSISKPIRAPSSLLMSAVAPITATLRAAGAFYTRQLSVRPVLTKSMTAGIIFGLSDWCAQLIEREDGENKSPVVLSRILTAFLVGLLFFGPAANAWYSAIFHYLPSTSLVSTLQKAALGQIFFGPAFTCVFFGAGMIEQGTFSLGNWVQKIKDDLPGAWAAGLGFWPLVDFVSYKIIPVHWIPLFVNFCSFVWTIYLSLVANRSKSTE